MSPEQRKIADRNEMFVAAGITGGLIILIVLLMLCGGCKSPKPTTIKPRPPSVDIPAQVAVVGSVREAIDTQASFIVAGAEGIKTQVSAGLAEQPDSQIFETIGIKADTIDGHARGILAESNKLTGVQEQLTKVKTDFANLQKDFADSQKMVKEGDAAIQTLKADNAAAVAELEKKIAKLESDATDFMKRILRWAMGICIGITLLSVAAGVYLRDKNAFAVAAAFGACGAVAYFMAQYLWFILIIGGVALACGIAYLVYYLRKHKVAIAEEVAKIEQLDDDAWAKLKPLLKTVSTETKELIESARIKLGSENK